MPKGYELPEQPDDVARFEGPYGVAALRRPHKSSTAPTKIGDSHARTSGYWRVVFVVKGLGADVYQVVDEDEGRKVGETLVNHGDLQGLEPNKGRYRVGGPTRIQDVKSQAEGE